MISRKKTYIRIAISLICWTTSAYALFFSALGGLEAFSDISKGRSEITNGIFIMYLWTLPWILLAIWNIYWIRDKKLDETWVIIGLPIGIAAQLGSLGGGLVLAPLASILAIYLMFFHLSKN